MALRAFESEVVPLLCVDVVQDHLELHERRHSNLPLVSLLADSQGYEVLRRAVLEQLPDWP